MKGALFIVLALLMGWFAAQSIQAHGYSLQRADNVFLQDVYDRIDDIETPQDYLTSLHSKLTSYTPESRTYTVLYTIAMYIERMSGNDTTTSSSVAYTPQFITLLSTQF